MPDLIAAHRLSSRASRSLNNPSLSDFVCSCGAEFIASDLTPRLPFHVPSLPQVHQHIAMGGEPVQTVTDAGDLAAVPTHAVVADAHGVLHRRWGGGSFAWSSQRGAHISDPADIALPVIVWWVP